MFADHVNGHLINQPTCEESIRYVKII